MAKELKVIPDFYDFMLFNNFTLFMVNLFVFLLEFSPIIWYNTSRIDKSGGHKGYKPIT